MPGIDPLDPSMTDPVMQREELRTTSSGNAYFSFWSGGSSSLSGAVGNGVLFVGAAAAVGGLIYLLFWYGRSRARDHVTGVVVTVVLAVGALACVVGLVVWAVRSARNTRALNRLAAGTEAASGSPATLEPRPEG